MRATATRIVTTIMMTQNWRKADGSGGGGADIVLENALKTHTMEISKLFNNMYVQNIL